MAYSRTHWASWCPGVCRFLLVFCTNSNFQNSEYYKIIEMLQNMLSSSKIRLYFLVVIMTILSVIWLYQKFFNGDFLLKHAELVSKYTNLHDLLNSFDASTNLTNCKLVDSKRGGNRFANCRLSLKESSNFFCEPPLSWNRRKHVYNLQDQMNIKQRHNTDTR